MGRWAVLAQNLIQNHCGAVSVAGGGGGGGLVGDFLRRVMSKTAGFEAILPPVRQFTSNYCVQNMGNATMPFKYLIQKKFVRDTPYLTITSLIKCWMNGAKLLFKFSLKL